MTQAVTVRAHAKINLSLRITATRPDGYHDLHTVFQTLMLHDTLRSVVRPGPFAITCDTPGIPLDESNLVWRAAAALWALLGRMGPPNGAAIEIRKRIPLQAGLGGGSSDAAAALGALAHGWGAVVPAPALMAAAATIGADVPFFLVGGTALGLGRGGRLSPLADLPARDVVLVLPAFGVSTAAAYGWYDEDQRGQILNREKFTIQDLPPVEFINDLQPPVARRHPEIAEIEAALLAAGAERAAMSGSGSAVFGLFSSATRARDAAAVLRARRWRVVRTRTLGHQEYDRRARPVAWKAVAGAARRS